MAALGDYTGNPNPDALASFTTQYQTAATEWDGRVREIWTLAHDSGRPPSCAGKGARVARGPVNRLVEPICTWPPAI
jgi:hypothetical protein